MAEPSEKSPAVEGFLEDMFDRTTSIKLDVCVWCKGEATEFDDDLSRKEYTISGLCQKCQNQVWGEDE